MHQRTTKGTAATQVPARTLMVVGSGSQAYEYIRRSWTKWQFRIRAASTMAFIVTRADYITSQSTYLHHYSLSRQEQVRGFFLSQYVLDPESSCLPLYTLFLFKQSTSSTHTFYSRRTSRPVARVVKEPQERSKHA